VGMSEETAMTGIEKKFPDTIFCKLPSVLSLVRRATNSRIFCKSTNRHTWWGIVKAVILLPYLLQPFSVEAGQNLLKFSDSHGMFAESSLQQFASIDSTAMSSGVESQKLPVEGVTEFTGSVVEVPDSVELDVDNKTANSNNDAKDLDSISDGLYLLWFNILMVFLGSSISMSYSSRK
jgi:hypothetical protein